MFALSLYKILKYFSLFSGDLQLLKDMNHYHRSSLLLVVHSTKVWSMNGPYGIFGVVGHLLSPSSSTRLHPSSTTRLATTSIYPNILTLFIFLRFIHITHPFLWFMETFSFKIVFKKWAPLRFNFCASYVSLAICSSQPLSSVINVLYVASIFSHQKNSRIDNFLAHQYRIRTIQKQALIAFLFITKKHFSVRPVVRFSLEFAFRVSRKNQLFVLKPCWPTRRTWEYHP